jgi:penicillin-insensitive murein endopeptidase
MKMVWIALFLMLSSPAGNAKTPSESLCYGSPKKGRLEAGWALPASGPNFRAYSWIGPAFERNYVHSRVYRSILAAYKALEKTNPDRSFVYGETGGREGGIFWPHVTHQNGLSVDFMVPVLDRSGKIVPFPSDFSNRFGYGLQFDEKGVAGDLRIDFEGMAEHLYQLDRATRKEGIGIRLVIFAPELTERLLQTRRGPYLGKHMQFYLRPARVRHDEHYHVDFKVPCLEEEHS